MRYGALRKKKEEKDIRNIFKAKESVFFASTIQQCQLQNINGNEFGYLVSLVPKQWCKV